MGLKAKYRWCLTGTPIHNSLDDYGALVTFVGVDPFHDKTKFDAWIATPLRETPREGIRRLKDLVRATCLRRTKASPTVHLDLLEPIQNLQHVNLSDEDQALYEFFRKKTAEIAANTGAAKQAKGSTATEDNILSHMNVLRRICNHGRALLPPRALTAWLHGRNLEAGWHIGAVFQAGCRLCGVDLGNPDDDEPRLPSLAERHRDSLCETCYATNEDSPDSKGSTEKQQGEKIASVLASTQPSAKVEALLKNLTREQNAESKGWAVNKRSVTAGSHPQKVAFCLDADL
jgi:SNF2 family DNA or RNA helicase